MSDENTDLERRVLAHEQILQAFIAYMVETDPKILERMREAFSHPIHIDTTDATEVDTAGYAARFVREVVRLGVTQSSLTEPSLVSKWDDLWPTSGEVNLRNENVPVRFEIRERDDLWEVLRNGKLSGGYISHSGALEAAKLAVQEVFTAGGSAELITGQESMPS
jgi:hypothetical protein